MPKKKEGPKKSTVQPSRKNPRPPVPRPHPNPQPRPQPKPQTRPSQKPFTKPQPRPHPRPHPKPTPNPQPRPSHRHTPRPRVRQTIVTEHLTPPMLMPKPWKLEQEAMERQRMEQYQSVVDAQLRNYADRMSIAYQISIDPIQKKANDVMRENDLGHVDTIYTEDDLKDIEEMFGPFTTEVNRSVLNPMQVQALRERIAQGRKEPKKRSTFKARKHAGKGTGF